MTQKQRILEVLSDGRWHTATELYRTGCVLHSRISDLRNKDGYTIERRNVGGVGAEAHEYRLVGGCVETSGGSGDLLSPAGVSTEPPGATSGASPAFTLAGDAGSALPDGQLVMVGAEFRKSEAA